MPSSSRSAMSMAAPGSFLVRCSSSAISFIVAQSFEKGTRLNPAACHPFDAVGDRQPGVDHAIVEGAALRDIAEHQHVADPTANTNLDLREISLSTVKLIIQPNKGRQLTNRNM